MSEVGGCVCLFVSLLGLTVASECLQKGQPPALPRLLNWCGQAGDCCLLGETALCGPSVLQGCLGDFVISFMAFISKSFILVQVLKALTLFPDALVITPCTVQVPIQTS